MQRKKNFLYIKIQYPITIYNGNLVAYKKTWGSHNGGVISAYFSVNKGDTLTYSGRNPSPVFIPLKK